MDILDSLEILLISTPKYAENDWQTIKCIFLLFLFDKCRLKFILGSEKNLMSSDRTRPSNLRRVQFFHNGRNILTNRPRFVFFFQPDANSLHWCDYRKFDTVAIKVALFCRFDVVPEGHWFYCKPRSQIFQFIQAAKRVRPKN